MPTLAVPLVEDLISSQEFISAENPIAWMKQKLMINEQEIQQIACFTTGQKENCMWSSVRKNRSTASNLVVFWQRSREIDILSPYTKDYAQLMICQRRMPLFGGRAMKKSQLKSIELLGMQL